MSKSFWLAVLRSIIVLLTIVAALGVAYYVLPLIYPFIIGILFALIFNPFVSVLERRAKFPRWLAVTVAIILLLAVLSTIVTLVILEIVAEVNRLSETLPGYVEEYVIRIQDFVLNDLLVFYDQFTAFYSSLEPDVQQSIEEETQELANQAATMGKDAVQSVFNGVLNFIGSVPNMATAFIISLLASFFISKDWPSHIRNYVNIVPEGIRHRTGAVFKDLKKALFGFVKAQLTLISITFVIVLIGFFILRIEYALTLALIIGVVDLLPYLGTGLVFIPWIVYLFINGDYSLVIGLSILYGIVVIQRQMMEPKILGTNVGLDPLLTLIALFVGFKLFGMLGLIIGPVSMVILGALHRAGVFKDIWTFIKGKS
ncbi:sporulation integral membrane protein YtvI [Caldalkalibacillus salinus]|uniref:sporulation integral membrane protein YtvI n=1 Tax=Caldalkalibacillus salinus TaxID=2803787 RepID=UPI001921D526|nr:sporulation integral membrane protein YtvI [Caldalkalibacillus salinus]